MTFEEWFSSTPRGHNPTLKEAFAAGAASVKPEVALVEAYRCGEDAVGFIQERDALLANNKEIKRELKRIHHAINDDRVDLTITASDAITELLADNKRLQKERDDLTQTSFDLCPECGWRTLIPTEGCIKCSAASVETEREECAKACDTIAEDWRGANSQAQACATAIRNRGTK